MSTRHSEALADGGARTSGVVTMDSPVADRLALYADLFHARTDVHAVRSQNARTRASGWMPAVAGGWRKGMDRARAAHLPLTPHVIASHLLGDVFVGLYPLLRDNSCRFLVADFDGPAAMLDALASTKAAPSSGCGSAMSRQPAACATMPATASTPRGTPSSSPH